MKRSGRQLYTERAYETVKQRILDNEWPAGHVALEQEVASELGMSRTPVREALIRLADEGLVEVRPRHGVRVLDVSASDMREIYQVLTALESTAAELVADRGIDAYQLAQLDACVDEMDAALTRDDLTAWAVADEQFHQLLIDLCGNGRLAGMVRTCRDQARRARMTTLHLRPKPTRSNDDHRATVDAIRRRDPTVAREIHRRHRADAGSMLIDILDKQGLTSL